MQLTFSTLQLFFSVFSGFNLNDCVEMFHQLYFRLYFSLMFFLKVSKLAHIMAKCLHITAGGILVPPEKKAEDWSVPGREGLHLHHQLMRTRTSAQLYRPRDHSGPAICHG